jgi:hypothetical protein
VEALERAFTAPRRTDVDLLAEAIEAGGHDRVAEQATSMAAALVGPPVGRAGADAEDEPRGGAAETAGDASGDGRS